MSASIQAEDTLLRFRWTLYRELDPAARTRRGLSWLNVAISLSIIGAVILAVLETEPSILVGHERLFDALETGFGVCFSVEYVARVWTAAENPKYGPGWRGRLRYVLSPTAVFDAMAIAVSFATPTGLTPFFLRAVRLLRIFRLAKLSRMTTAMGFLVSAIVKRRDELLFSLFVGVFFLLLSATCLYFVEGTAQPDKFGSIPRSLWWATATLTTIGYGDVYPITALGKVLAAISAIAGIGLVAMPTGIMAAAFSDAVQRHSEDRGPVTQRERIASLLAVGSTANDLVQRAVGALTPNASALDYLETAYSPPAFDDVIRALDRVKLEDLQDFDLVELVVVLRRLVGRSKHVLDKMAHEARSKGVSPERVASFAASASRIAAIQRALSTRSAALD